MSGAFAHKIPARETTLGDLISQHIKARQLWTPETDGLDLDIADEARSLIMFEFGLSKEEAEYLGRMML